MPNQLYQKQRQMDPVELMRKVKAYQGTPQQAREEAEKMAREMGIPDDQFEAMKQQAKQLAQMMGL